VCAACYIRGVIENLAAYKSKIVRLSESPCNQSGRTTLEAGADNDNLGNELIDCQFQEIGLAYLSEFPDPAPWPGQARPGQASGL